MRFAIGIILIVTSSVLFTLLLLENTPWIMVSSPLFLIGFGLICSKICEMEDNITWLEMKLDDLSKEERSKKQ